MAEEITETNVVQDPPLKRLYDGLYADKKYTKSFNDFGKKFNNPEAIKKLYLGLKEDGDYSRSESDFNSQYFSDVKKKDLPQGSKNTSTVFTKPLQPSQANTASSNLFGGKPQNEFIGKEREQQVFNQLNKEDDKRQATSNRLKQIQAAYAGDTEQMNVAQSLPRDQGQITQGLAEEGIVDKTIGVSKYLGNEALRGVGQVASGVGDAILNLGVQSGMMPKEVLSAYRGDVATGVRDVFKNQLGADLDKRREAEYRDETILGALGGLANSVPAIALSIGSGGLGTSAMFFQGYDGALQSINQTEVGKTIDEGTKTIYAGGVGLVGAALEKFGLDKILKSETGIVSNYIMNKALSNAIKASDGKITGDVLTNLINKEVIDLTGRVARIGTKAIDGYITEAFTGGAQEVANVGAEYLLNAATGKSVFNTEDMSKWQGFVNNIKRVGLAANAEGIGGTLMGGLSKLANNKPSDINNKITQLRDINTSLQNENISDVSREVLVQQKINIQNEVDAEQNKIEEWFSKADTSTKEKIFNLAEQKSKLEEALLDANLPETTKKNIKEQSAAIDAELGNIKPTTETTPVSTEANVADIVTETPLSEITPIKEVVPTETVKPIENDKLPTNNTQSQVQVEIQPVKDEVVPVKVEDAKTTPIPKVEEVKEAPKSVEPLATETTKVTDKSNLDLEFIADDSIPKETVDAYNKKGKLAGTTQVPNEKLLAKQNEIKSNLETLKKFTKCLTS